MTKVSNILEEVLYEKLKEKSMKLFYKINVFLQDFKEKEDKEKEKEEPVQTQTPEPQSVQQPQPTQTQQSQPVQQQTESINEDIFKSNGEGVLTVEKEKAENIQTLNDLLDYVSDNKENNKSLLNDLVIEIILNVINQSDVSDIINKGDKVIIDIDYGFDKDDSIGIKVNKVAGSESISINMKKDFKILSGPFNLTEFNKQIIFYRNSLLD